MATWTGTTTATTEDTFDENETESGVWRKTVCDRCCECADPLDFMEGPLCDRCIDEGEMSDSLDRYANFHDGIPTRTHAVYCTEAETPVPRCRNITRILKKKPSDKLVVNLETREITLFKRR